MPRPPHAESGDRGSGAAISVATATAPSHPSPEGHAALAGMIRRQLGILRRSQVIARSSLSGAPASLAPAALIGVDRGAQGLVVNAQVPSHLRDRLAGLPASRTASSVSTPRGKPMAPRCRLSICDTPNQRALAPQADRRTSGLAEAWRPPGRAMPSCAYVPHPS
jgi:hypothetical protein